MSWEAKGTCAPRHPRKFQGQLVSICCSLFSVTVVVVKAVVVSTKREGQFFRNYYLYKIIQPWYVFVCTQKENVTDISVLSKNSCPSSGCNGPQDARVGLWNIASCRTCRRSTR